MSNVLLPCDDTVRIYSTHEREEIVSKKRKKRLTAVDYRVLLTEWVHTVAWEMRRLPLPPDYEVYEAVFNAFSKQVERYIWTTVIMGFNLFNLFISSSAGWESKQWEHSEFTGQVRWLRKVVVR